MPVSSDSKSIQEQLLAIITEDLNYLDRTEFVHDISKYPVINAASDIHEGFYSRTIFVDNNPRTTEIKVHLKSLRRPNRDREEYVKVGSISLLS